jgi:hypothetical protein
MAFNDGEPLDAAKLGALELQINNLSANIPKIGASTTNVTVNNQTVQQANIPQIVGNAFGEPWALKLGHNTKDFQFPGTGLNSIPKAVILTTRHGGSKNVWTPAVGTKTGSITQSGFTAHVFLPSGCTPHNIYISYMAICY